VTLEGRVVIVAGGSRGIGRSCVLEAASRGAKVVFCSRQDDAESRALEADAEALAGCALGVRGDVSREEDMAAVFDAAYQRFGPVAAVVCSAALSRESLLVTMGASDWDEVVATNLTGSFVVARQAIRGFLEQNSGGRVVLLGTLSQNGVAGNSAYAASKGGILGLTRLLARQYASRRIWVNAVVPGYVPTAMSSTLSDTARRSLIDGCPLRRAGSPEEIASVVAFLLSADTPGLSGQAIFASGGMLETPL
jgi:3-oxoacyl-[acyl-carrier protein] reductase